jgi:fructokinase
MRKIYAIGETLLDIIFKNGQPQAAKPGGAMLNSTVSLGRIGLPVYLVSEYADDDIGKLIDKFLNENGVGTNFVDHYRDGTTALAIAILNEKNDASYTFYKNYPSKRLEMLFPPVNKDDLILCGSIYAITTAIRKKFTDFIKYSGDQGAIVIYDPNFRKAHASELPELKPLIIENMKMARLIRGSDEDFKNIFGTDTPDEAWETIRQYCNCLVYTSSAEAVYVRTISYSGKFPVRSLKPISTIGAGDNFNAGMMAAIYKYDISVDQLEKIGEREWLYIVSTGIDFASDVCMSYENYISSEFARKMAP